MEIEYCLMIHNKRFEGPSNIITSSLDSNSKRFMSDINYYRNYLNFDPTHRQLKRSFSEICDDFSDEDDLKLNRRNKFHVTEDKVADAFNNLHLVSTSKAATNTPQTSPTNNDELEIECSDMKSWKSNNRVLITSLDDDLSDDCSSSMSSNLVLSEEVKSSLRNLKEHTNSELDLIKRLAKSTQNIHADSQLQIVLWEPNIAEKITNELSANNNNMHKLERTNSNKSDSSSSIKTISSSTETESMNEESIDNIDSSVVVDDRKYTIEEPPEAECKRSLKRTYSQVNQISIEELVHDTNRQFDGYVYKRNVDDEPSKYYIVDEPVNNNNNNGKNTHNHKKSNEAGGGGTKTKNTVKIEEINDEDEDSINNWMDFNS